jgi:small subunit ribosomal protein S8
MTTDPISDFITRIRNAGAVGQKFVSIPHSALKLEIAEKLRQYGYVQSLEKHGKKVKKTIRIELKYTPAFGTKRIHRISGVGRVSRPGRRIYRKADGLRPVKGGHGMLVLSTPRGILSDAEARKAHVGGEVLFKIW